MFPGAKGLKKALYSRRKSTTGAEGVGVGASAGPGTTLHTVTEGQQASTSAAAAAGSLYAPLCVDTKCANYPANSRRLLAAGHLRSASASPHINVNAGGSEEHDIQPCHNCANSVGSGIGRLQKLNTQSSSGYSSAQDSPSSPTTARLRDESFKRWPNNGLLVAGKPRRLSVPSTMPLIVQGKVVGNLDTRMANALGTAEPWEISKIINDSPECVYSIFMKSHRCYDLIPTSTKLVVFDTQLPVRKAFFALVYNGVRAAPLWNSELQRFVGMLTITDFIAILHKYYRSGQTGGIKELEQHKIVTWREVMLGAERSKTHLISVDPTESLYRAVQILCANHVHRLPVLDTKSGNIAYILTHKRLIKYLYLYIYDLPKPAFLDKTPKELGIGSWGDITTVSPDTSLIKVLSIFLKKRISAVPIVDADGRVIDIYAKFDVITLAADNAYNDLEASVSDALKHRSGWFEGVRSCQETDSLSTVIETLVKAEIHRMLITDAEKRVVGIVSLSDILKYLVLDHAPTEAVKHKLSDIMLAETMEEAPPKKGASVTASGDDDINNDIVTINE